MAGTCNLKATYYKSVILEKKVLKVFLVLIYSCIYSSGFCDIQKKLTDWKYSNDIKITVSCNYCYYKKGKFNKNTRKILAINNDNFDVHHEINLKHQNIICHES